jgi:hypothetical protein
MRIHVLIDLARPRYTRARALSLTRTREHARSRVNTRTRTRRTHARTHTQTIYTNTPGEHHVPGVDTQGRGGGVN